MITRRTFTASAIAAAACPVRAAGKLNLGIGTYTYHSLSIDDMIAQLKRLEIEEIEMSRGEFMLFSKPKPERFESAQREAGSRTTEVHLRNKIGETPTESFGDGNIDHREIAGTMKQLKIQPLVVIELAYHSDTPITRPFRENVRLSRIYAEKVFHL